MEGMPARIRKREPKGGRARERCGRGKAEPEIQKRKQEVQYYNEEFDPGSG